MSWWHHTNIRMDGMVGYASMLSWWTGNKQQPPLSPTVHCSSFTPVLYEGCVCLLSRMVDQHVCVWNGYPQTPGELLYFLWVSVTYVMDTLVVRIVDHWKVTGTGVLTHLAELLTRLIMYVILNKDYLTSSVRMAQSVFQEPKWSSGRITRIILYPQNYCEQCRKSVS